MTNDTMNESFLDDLRTIAATAAKMEFDRNWTIFAARLDGDKMQDIADAASLSRMQVTRIIRELRIITEDLLAANPGVTIQDLIDHAWGCDSWEQYDATPIVKGERDDE